MNTIDFSKFNVGDKVFVLEFANNFTYMYKGELVKKENERIDIADELVDEECDCADILSIYMPDVVMMCKYTDDIEINKNFNGTDSGW